MDAEKREKAPVPSLAFARSSLEYCCSNDSFMWDRKPRAPGRGAQRRAAIRDFFFKWMVYAYGGLPVVETAFVAMQP